MAARDVNFSCHCGALRGRLNAVTPASGSLVICYCRDCRAYARHLGLAGVLDGHGGTEIYQTTPDLIEITDGAENLAVLRLSPKGLLRWYAGCCRTPVANTVPKAGFAFAGQPVVVFPDPDARDGFGPVICHAHVQSADLPDPKLRGFGFLSAGAAILRRHIAARLAGRRATPFFDAEGAPRVAPRVLSPEERAAAYAPGS